MITRDELLTWPNITVDEHGNVVIEGNVIAFAGPIGVVANASDFVIEGNTIVLDTTPRRS